MRSDRREFVTLALAGAGVVGALAWAGSPAAALHSGQPDALVLGATLAAGWLGLAWLVLGTATAVASRLPGAAGCLAGAVADRITPAILRRAVDLALGATLTTGAATGLGGIAWADVPPPAPAVASLPSLDWPTVDAGGWVPESPSAPSVPPVRISHRTPVAAVTGPPVVTTHAAAPVIQRPVRNRSQVSMSPAPNRDSSRAPTAPSHRVAEGLGKAEPARPEHGRGPTPTAPTDWVLVRPGDSLWSIAARWLGPGANADSIASTWPRWYAENRVTVGDDPALIFPGQRLRAPQ
ncbi:MAG TPA: LysM peptidoglycan-binding domain-containing protein [Mycobacteriales bacterium]|nr:LysM peptidoglycan-binding domain-containing protein [Mycobacteriales bacterium]